MIWVFVGTRSVREFHCGRRLNLDPGCSRATCRPQFLGSLGLAKPLSLTAPDFHSVGPTSRSSSCLIGRMVGSENVPVILKGDADKLAAGSDAHLRKELLHRVLDRGGGDFHAECYLFVG